MMRFFLLYLFLSTANSWAKDYQYFSPHFDKFTKEISYVSKEFKYSNGGKQLDILFIIKENGRDFYMYITPKIMDCTEPEFSVLALTANAETIKLYNHNKFDCDGPSVIIRGYPDRNHYLLPEKFKKMRDDGIIAMRFDLYKSRFDYDFTKSQTIEMVKVMSEMQDICTDLWGYNEK